MGQLRVELEVPIWAHRYEKNEKDYGKK